LHALPALEYRGSSDSGGNAELAAAKELEVLLSQLRTYPFDLHAELMQRAEEMLPQYAEQYEGKTCFNRTRFILALESAIEHMQFRNPRFRDFRPDGRQIACYIWCCLSFADTGVANAPFRGMPILD
jgi:hypothetical protein